MTGNDGPCLDSDIEAAETHGDMRELFLELRAPLCRYLVSLGLGRTEAEDVAQESFLRLCQRSGTKDPANVRPWIFRVAHNLARDEHRRRKRRPAAGSEDEAAFDHADQRPSPEQNLLQREQDTRLKTALAQLPEEQRQCLHLRAEGLRYREIAEVLDVGTSTVSERVQKALQSLSRELGKQ